MYTYLAFIEHFLRNLILKNLGRLCPLQDLVLPERQESLQQVLAQRESNQDGLPWEEWAVQKTRQLLFALQSVSQHSSAHKSKAAYLEYPHHERQPAPDVGERCVDG